MPTQSGRLPIFVLALSYGLETLGMSRILSISSARPPGSCGSDQTRWDGNCAGFARDFN